MLPYNLCGAVSYVVDGAFKLDLKCSLSRVVDLLSEIERHALPLLVI